MPKIKKKKPRQWFHYFIIWGNVSPVHALASCLTARFYKHADGGVVISKPRSYECGVSCSAYRGYFCTFCRNPPVRGMKIPTFYIRPCPSRTECLKRGRRKKDVGVNFALPLHSVSSSRLFVVWTFSFYKGKGFPLQAWSGSWGSRRLRLLDLLDIRHCEGGKVVTPRSFPGTHF